MGRYRDCAICGSSTELIYEPKKSVVGIQILICEVCGFVQSQKSHVGVDYQGLPVINFLSCDADYSPIRVGKQQMTNVDTKHIENSNLSGIEGFDFLDMASARGHFARWARSTSQSKVVCFEPDEYIADSYTKDSTIELHIGDYREIEITDKFDFIYSCHTLEHFKDPIAYLNYVYDHLKPEGYFYVNVPNLSGIIGVVALDDFFYDKHRVYFDLSTLKTLLGNQGFAIVSEWVDLACIRLLVRKTDIPEIRAKCSSYISNRDLISTYVANLEHSRSELPALVEQLLSNLDEDSIWIVLGCGRMLDALVCYGNLDLSYFDYLVDNYLGLATKTLYGRDLFTLDDLPAVEGQIQFAVVSRTSNQEIGDLIASKFPESAVFYFGNLTNN